MTETRRLAIAVDITGRAGPHREGDWLPDPTPLPVSYTHVMTGPPPSPIELARRELDAIDRATGLAQLPGWRPLTGPGSITIPPMELLNPRRGTTSRGPR